MPNTNNNLPTYIWDRNVFWNFLFCHIYFRVHNNAANQCDDQKRRTCDSEHFDPTVLVDEPYQYHGKYYTDDCYTEKRASVT